MDISREKRGDKTRLKIKVKKIKLNIKHAFLKVSIASYEINTPTKEPTPIPTEGPGKGICGINTPIPTSEFPTERKDLNLPIFLKLLIVSYVKAMENVMIQ